MIEISDSDTIDTAISDMSRQDFLFAAINPLQKITYLVYLNSILCAFFLLLLGYGFYFQDVVLLSALNGIKYLIILLLAFSLYCSYKQKNMNFLYPIIAALIILWFVGFDFAYRWDAIQHVARAKFYMDHTFFGSDERHSFLYLVWGFLYRIFGESETITHLTNMIIGLAGIFGIYSIAKDLYNEFVASISIIISLTLPVFFMVNKWAYLDMPFVTFVVFTFLLLMKYVKTKNEGFLVLTLVCAGISMGIKEPGFILFFVIGVIVWKYNSLSKRVLLILTAATILSIYYLVTIMMSITKFSNFQSEFSIISPLTYGFNAVVLWAASLNMEFSQLLYSGLLILAIAAVINRNSENITYYFLIISGFISLCGIAFFPSNNLFVFPLIPDGNYPFYLGVAGLVLCGLSGLYVLKKCSFSFDDNVIVLLLWLGSFLVFFLIVGRIFGYGEQNLLDVSLLDYRYLMPAFPPLIILFSRGFEVLITATSEKKIKGLAVLFVSSLILINIIVSLNFAFFFAHSGNTHLEGYTYARNISQDNIIYSHWPFVYSPAGNMYNLGQYSWVEDNLTYKSIFSEMFEPGSVILASSHFFPTKILNANVSTLTAKSLFLDPVTPVVSVRAIDSVYIGIVPYRLVLLSDGFYAMEQWGSIPTYWTKDDSKIKIFSQDTGNVTLSFIGQSYLYDRILTVSANNNFITAMNISVNSTNVTAVLPLDSGENVISLHTSEDCDRPKDIPGGESNDPRCLSIAIQNITVQ